MAEQQPHSEPTPGEQDPRPDTPGSDLQQRGGADPDGPPIDPEQLRQFQQFQEFQEFQEFQRFQELQRQAGTELTPGQPPQPPVPAGGQPPPRPRVPRWVRWLGKKILGWLIFIALTALALYWAYDYFIEEEDTDKPAAETGGGTYHTNEILAKQPYEAVRGVYDAIAQGADPRYACGRFDRQTQRAFASNLGYADCEQAVRDLQTKVTHANDYAESLPSSISRPVTGNTVRVDSCEFDIEGGPALGTFTVTRVERGQWLITGHRGPSRCPTQQPPTTTPTR